MPSNLFWLCDEKREIRIMTTGMIEEKCSRGKQREKMLDGLTKWFKVERLTEALQVMRDRDASTVMIAFPK